MITIYKYTFPAVEEWPQHVEKGVVRLGIKAPIVRLLDLQMQREGLPPSKSGDAIYVPKVVPTVWAMVNTDKEDLPWEFIAVPTGYEFRGENLIYNYFRTLQVGHGLVFHFFHSSQRLQPG